MWAGWRRWSLERDDELAVGAGMLDVRQRLKGPVERECLVDERVQVAGVVEGASSRSCAPFACATAAEHGVLLP